MKAFRFLQAREGYFKKFIDMQMMEYKHEDIGYKGAFLAKMRNFSTNYLEEHGTLPPKSNKNQEDIEGNTNDLDYFHLSLVSKFISFDLIGIIDKMEDKIFE